MTRHLSAIAVVLLAAGRLPAADPKPDASEAEFALRVLPLLKAKCLACHGADGTDLKGGLDLTSLSLIHI